MKYLSVDEVAARLGFSTKWVYERVKDFPGAFKVRGVIRIPEGAISKWIEANNELVSARDIGIDARSVGQARRKLAALKAA